jgi:hypothetical protein
LIVNIVRKLVIVVDKTCIDILNNNTVKKLKNNNNFFIKNGNADVKIPINIEQDCINI